MTIGGVGGNRLASEINMTPMIDVLLVLLIIFMVIVPVISKGEATVTAHKASQVTPSEPGAVVLEVLKDRSAGATFRINRQSISWAELPARLESIYVTRAQRVIFVKGDDQLSFRQIAEVIDISHAAGIDRVCLMTPKTAQ